MPRPPPTQAGGSAQEQPREELATGPPPWGVPAFPLLHPPVLTQEQERSTAQARRRVHPNPPQRRPGERAHSLHSGEEPPASLGKGLLLTGEGRPAPVTRVVRSEDGGRGVSRPLASQPHGRLRGSRCCCPFRRKREQLYAFTSANGYPAQRRGVVVGQGRRTALQKVRPRLATGQGALRRGRLLETIAFPVTNAFQGGRRAGVSSRGSGAASSAGALGCCLFRTFFQRTLAQKKHQAREMFASGDVCIMFVDAWAVPISLANMV